MAITSGADIQALNGLGTKFSNTWAGQLEQLTAEINAAVESSGDIWAGQDAEKFRGTVWPNHKQQLINAVEALRTAGQIATSNARAQEQTSNAIN